jgi:thiosulfate dehydrogenase [quinone] large subunit
VHVVGADLLAADKRPIAHWDAAALSALPHDAFANDYAYNKFAAGPFGIRAPMGAAATVTLPPPRDVPSIVSTRYLRLTDVDGRSFTAALASASPGK